MNLGEILCWVMDRQGFTIAKLSKVSGWSADSIYRWRKNLAVPNAMAMYDMAQAMGVKVGVLYGEKHG